MGLRAPQDEQKVQLRQEGSQRFSGAVAPHVDRSSLSTISTALTARENAQAALKKTQMNFVRKSFSNDVESLRLEAQGNLALSPGESALEAAPKIEEDFDAKVKDTMAKYHEDYHPYLQQDAATIKNKYKTFEVPYVVGQVNKIQSDTDKTFLANQRNSAVEFSGNDELFGTVGLANVEVAARDIARKTYGDSSPMVDAAIHSIKSDTIQGAVEIQATSGDINKAQALFDKYKDEMTPGHQVKSMQILAKAKLTIGNKDASDLATVAMQNNGGDLVLAEKELRRVAKDDKQLKLSTSFLTNQATLMDKQQRIQQDTSLAKLNKGLQSGKSLNDVQMQDEFNKLDPQTQNSYINQINNNGGKPIATLTNWKSYKGLADELNNVVSADDPNFKNLNLDSYRHSISAKDMAPLESQYNRIKGEKNKETANIRRNSYKVVSDMLPGFYKANGIYTSEDKGKVETNVRDLTERLLDENPKISEQDLRNRTALLMRDQIKKTVPVNSWRNAWGIGGFLEPKDTEEQINTSGFTTDVKPHQSVIDAIKSKHPGYTESEVNAAIKHAARNGYDVTKPVK